MLGGLTVIYLLPPAVSVSHACLAQLYFSTTVALALFTSRDWLAGAHEIPQKPCVCDAASAIAGDLRIRCGTILPQLARAGAASSPPRKCALGAIWHICFSSIVTGVVVWFGRAGKILLHWPQITRCSARNAGDGMLLGITFVQVFLGIAAYMSRIATIDAPQPQPVMILFTVLHVATGALTMAASVIMAIQVYRNVRRPEHQFAPRGVAVA